MVRGTYGKFVYCDYFEQKGKRIGGQKYSMRRSCCFLLVFGASEE